MKEELPEVEDQVDKALTLLNRGNHAEAKQLMSSILSKNPTNHLVHYGIGCIHVQNDEFDTAFIHFKTSVEIFPYFSEGWHNLDSASIKTNNRKTNTLNNHP